MRAAEVGAARAVREVDGPGEDEEEDEEEGEDDVKSGSEFTDGGWEG